MADAQPEQQPRGVGRPFRLDRGEQIVDRLVLPPFAADQVAAMGLQPKNIGRPLVEPRSEEHTSELQSLMRSSYAVFCLKKKKHKSNRHLNPSLAISTRQQAPILPRLANIRAN